MPAEGSKFVLVRWVEDESYGVMPLRAVPPKEQEDVYPGQFTRMKWRGSVSSKFDFSYELRCFTLSF